MKSRQLTGGLHPAGTALIYSLARSSLIDILAVNTPPVKTALFPALLRTMTLQTYPLFVSEPRLVFGSTEWDHNLWDAACYGAASSRTGASTFTLNDLVSWFDDGADDPEGNVRKAFYFALERHLHRGLVSALDPFGQPDPDLVDARTVFAHARVDDWRFRFQLLLPKSVMVQPLQKPAGYLTNGWARTLNKHARGVLNSLLAIGQQGGDSIPLTVLLAFHSRIGFIKRKNVSSGIAALESAGLVTVRGETLSVHLEGFNAPPDSLETRTPPIRTLRQVLPRADAILGGRLEHVLDRLQLLHHFLRRPRLLSEAYKDMRYWGQSFEYPFLLAACDTVSKVPTLNQRWGRTIAQATARYRRFRAGAGKFSIKLDSPRRLMAPMFPLDIRTLTFKRAECTIVSPAQLDGPVRVDLTILDGHGNLLGSVDLVIEKGARAKQILAILDVTDPLRRYAGRLVGEEEPTIGVEFSAAPPNHEMQLTVSIHVIDPAPCLAP